MSPNGMFIPKNEEIIVGILITIVAAAKNFIAVFILLDTIVSRINGESNDSSIKNVTIKGIEIEGKEMTSKEMAEKIATREAYGKALAEFGAEYENLVVLDADLAAATKTGIFKKL